MPDHTVEENYSTEINEILEWAEDNDWFDPSFILSLKTLVDKGYKLSEKQAIGLFRVYDMMLSRCSESDE